MAWEKVQIGKAVGRVAPDPSKEIMLIVLQDVQHSGEIIEARFAFIGP